MQLVAACGVVAKNVVFRDLHPAFVLETSLIVKIIVQIPLSIYSLLLFVSCAEKHDMASGRVLKPFTHAFQVKIKLFPLVSFSVCKILHNFAKN